MIYYYCKIFQTLTKFTKGQLISNGPFGVIVWTKQTMKDFCPSL